LIGALVVSSDEYGCDLEFWLGRKYEVIFSMIIVEGGPDVRLLCVRFAEALLDVKFAEALFEELRSSPSV
jgi:hypothetical protein